MAAPAQPAPFKIEGKTALITGAGSGINFCFAKALVDRKCNVLIADLALRPEAQKLMDDNQSSPRVAFVKTDVRLWDDLSNMFDVADKEFGGVDIVCPGAGVFEPLWSNFWLPPGNEKSKDDPHGKTSSGVGSYATLDINITHPIRTTQLAVSRWLNPSPNSKVGKAAPTNPKRVVAISSIAGQKPGFPYPLYIASKHAISGFVRSMVPLEAAYGIKINGVAPGLIKTPLWTDHPEKIKTIDESLDSWTTPEEVAEQMVRCVEDEAIEAGVIWEVLQGRYRVVDWKDVKAPEGPGSGIANGQMLLDEVFDWLKEPGWGAVKK